MIPPFKNSMVKRVPFFQSNTCYPPIIHAVSMFSQVASAIAHASRCFANWWSSGSLLLCSTNSLDASANRAFASADLKWEKFPTTSTSTNDSSTIGGPAHADDRLPAHAEDTTSTQQQHESGLLFEQNTPLPTGEEQQEGGSSSRPTSISPWPSVLSVLETDDVRGEDAREELTTVVAGCKLYFAGGSCWWTQLGFGR